MQGGGHDEKEQTLNQLLVGDGRLRSIRGPRHHRRDQPAGNPRPGADARWPLRPAGVVDRPDKIGRAEILKVHARRSKLGDDVDLEQVAQI